MTSRSEFFRREVFHKDTGEYSVCSDQEKSPDRSRSAEQTIRNPEDKGGKEIRLHCLTDKKHVLSPDETSESNPLEITKRAEEKKKKGINILTLCPGNMNTELNPKGTDKQIASSLPYLNLKKITHVSLKRAEKGKGFYTLGFLYKCYRLASKLMALNQLMEIGRGVMEK